MSEANRQSLAEYLSEMLGVPVEADDILHVKLTPEAQAKAMNEERMKALDEEIHKAIVERQELEDEDDMSDDCTYQCGYVAGLLTAKEIMKGGTGLVPFEVPE